MICVDPTDNKRKITGIVSYGPKMFFIFYQIDWLPWLRLWVLTSKSSWDNNHSWQKFKIVLVKKTGRKFYSFHSKNLSKHNFWEYIVEFPFIFWIQFFKVVVNPSNFWFQNVKVVVFPSNFWKTTIIWQFFRVILNFSQECYYLKNKVGVVDFTKARGLVKFQSPRALRALGL